VTAIGAAAPSSAVQAVRAVAAPLACGLALIVLLAIWTIAGGGGVSRIEIQVTQASVPMSGFARTTAPAGPAAMYLTITNLTGSADRLLSATSADAASVQVVSKPGMRAPAGLVIPAGQTVSLSPFGADLELIRPVRLQLGQQVRLSLRFARAGLVTVDATVTPPGTP
jgi:copper(I)-binding protein